MLALRQTVTRQLTYRKKSAMREFPRRFPRVTSSDLSSAPRLLQRYSAARVPIPLYTFANHCVIRRYMSYDVVCNNIQLGTYDAT